LSYLPLDRQILTSSIWSDASPEALKVWLYLLLSADPRDGVVRETVPAIAQRCGLSVQGTEEILSWFGEADKYSRSQDSNGKRIKRTKDGIQLITYVKHRDRDYSTPRVRKYRAEKKKASQGNVVSPLHETMKQNEMLPETTDTDTDTKESKPLAVQTPPLSPNVYWDTEQNQVAIDKEWLWSKLRDFVKEAGVEFVTDDYEKAREDLRLKLLSDTRLRAVLRKADGEPSKPSQFRRLGTYTVTWFETAIRQKAKYQNRGNGKREDLRRAALNGRESFEPEASSTWTQEQIAELREKERKRSEEWLAKQKAEREAQT
jgi:hypothetical protein